MRKKALWGLVAAALIVTPAVIGLIVVGGDSGRNQAALVAEGQAAGGYQLVLDNVTPAGQAIDVESYSWGVENPTTIGSATSGAGAGKAKFNEFTIQKKIDEASPILFKQMATGTHSPTATLKLYKGGESKTGNPYVIYTFKTVFITKVDHSGGAPEQPEEEVTFVYGAVTLDTGGTSPTGKPAATSKFGWNQVLNKAEVS
jgi:type VI secretion system secreted protein Hcp